MSSQLGFHPGDPCIAQLLSIVHEIQIAFDNNPNIDVKGVFLDISKAFHKVWHDGLVFKLSHMVLRVNYFCYSKNLEQKVVLNGQTSGWREINTGVPQGSVLAPLLFLIYINDLPDGITSMCKMFSDDASLSSKVLYINLLQNLVVT